MSLRPASTVEPASSPRRDRLEAAWGWASVGVLLLALVLRRVGLQAESLWFDEGHSVLVARMMPSEAVAALARDVHPPLYFLTLGAWVRVFGESDEALRSLSVLFGVVAVGGVLALGRRLGGDRAGLVAGLLAAVSPFFVAYAREVRPYALLLALAMLATLALLRLAERPRSTSRRAVYALALASLPYTHALGLFVGLAHGILVLVRVARPRPDDAPGLLRAALAGAGGALLLFAPWVPSLLRQEEGVRTTGWIAPPGWREFQRAAVSHAGGEAAFVAIEALAFCGLLLADRCRRPDRPRLTAGLLFAVPLVVPVIVSSIGPAIFLPRTTIVSAAGLFLLAGLGASRIATPGPRDRVRTRRTRVVLAAALVVAAVAFSMRALAVQLRKPKNSEVREAIALVEQRAQPGDVVVVGHEFEGALADHYLRRADLVVAHALDAVPRTARSLWVIVTLHTRNVPRPASELEQMGFRPATVDHLHRVELRRYDR